MSKLDKELLHTQLDKLLGQAPSFGDLTITARFRDGKIHTILSNTSRSTLAEELRVEAEAV